MGKICIVCEIEKDIKYFDRIKKSKDGYRNQCKSCLYEKRSIRYEGLSVEEKEILRINKNERNRRYWNNNIKNTEFKSNQSKRKRNTHLKRLEDDPLYKLKISYIRRLNKSIKNFNVIDIKFLDALGCSLDEFKIHIESRFEHWMNWNNYGKYNGELNHGWDIDHILPISSAKTESEFYELCHYINLQPLCSKINRDIKKNKIKNTQ